MKPDKAQLRELLEKKEWTEEEKQMIYDYLQNSVGEELKEIAEADFQLSLAGNQKIDPSVSEKMLKEIHLRISDSNGKSKIRKLWIVRIAAASIFIALLTAGIFYLRKPDPKVDNTVHLTPAVEDVAPGSNKAILTLDNGLNIILDTALNGSLAIQGNTQIIKKDGSLAYNTQQQIGIAQSPVFNTVSTPKGGQYQLILADGSKVWLNAASSIRFPSAFTGRERIVELQGEAYFEIAKNKTMPFHVKANGSDIEVLGTHFNINAYNDEATVTATLVEGSVKLSAAEGKQYALLSPNQQAKAEKNGTIKMVNNPDIEEALAWKYGRFQFDNTDIETVMRQISRWYDVEVVFEKPFTDVKLKGKMQRNLYLSQIIKGLDDEDVHFRIEGKKLILYK